MNEVSQNLKLSVVLPCRDEEAAVGECILKIKQVLEQNNIDGEIIVSDSSADSSAKIAQNLGAVLIQHGREGYGTACLEGFKAAKGKYIFLADADGSYDFAEIPNFLAHLELGNDFVIGNRFKGKIAPGAMPLLHRFVGNPLFPFMFRIFFRAKIQDVHCGMRAVAKESLAPLALNSTGMEFASEMLIKAVQNKLKIHELSINYYKRKGVSKLRPFADGFRHLRLIVLAGAFKK